MSSLEFRLRKIDETRKYLIEEINHNDFMSERYNKTCKCLNYIENLLIVASTLSDSASISAFASLVVIPVSITSSLVGIEICTITAGVKKHKSVKMKNKKEYDKIVLLRKDKLNINEVPISEPLIASYISQKEIVSVNNVLRQQNEMEVEIKNSETPVEYTT